MGLITKLLHALYLRVGFYLSYHTVSFLFSMRNFLLLPKHNNLDLLEFIYARLSITEC